MKGSRGFTLVELMIVVAIVAILAAIGLPTFTQALARAQEGTTKGSLGTLRTSINLYIGAQEGVAPPDMESLMPQYLPRIPATYTPGVHPISYNTNVPISYTISSNDTCILNPAESWQPGGGWLYRFPNAGATINGTFHGYCNPGTVVVNCSHQDSRGVVWGDY